MQAFAPALSAARDALARVPPGCFRILADGPPTSAPDPIDDYPVYWRVLAEPVQQNACSLEVWFSSVHPSEPNPYACAFGFDSWEAMARRHGLKAVTRKRFAFGVEPVRVSCDQIHAIVSLTLDGQLEARYVSFFGRIASVSGWLSRDVGVPDLCRRKLRLGTRVRYSGYADA